MKKKLLSGVFIGVVLGFFIFQLIPSMSFGHGEMDDMRDEFISLKSSIQGGMRGQHMYRCCLEKPCAYCIEKTPGHGEGAACDCLSDIVNGVHPCGECIGEILEGHGNLYLAEYFAVSIAEEVGEAHLDTLRQIIFEKYGIPVENQL